MTYPGFITASAYDIRKGYNGEDTAVLHTDKIVVRESAIIKVENIPARWLIDPTDAGDMTHPNAKNHFHREYKLATLPDGSRYIVRSCALCQEEKTSD